MTEIADTTASEPELTWNGERWLTWDGTEWVAVDPQPPRPTYPAQVTVDGEPMALTTITQPRRTEVVTDKRGAPIQVIVAWVLTVLTLGYMLPWAIAATRGKANAGAIGLVNLLLGWTVIGWIVALVMACGAHQVGGVRVV
jgi:hypothetical protein